MPRARRTGADIPLGLATLAAWFTRQRAADVAHPDTEPEAIRADQRAAVAEVLRELGEGATDEAVSEAVVLPVSVVKRRRAELASEAERTDHTTRAA